MPVVNLSDNYRATNNGNPYETTNSVAGWNLAPATVSQTPINNTGPNAVVPQGTPPLTTTNGAPVTALPNNGGAGPGSAIDYQLHPGETIAQYNARIAAANPNLPAPGTTSSTGVTNNAISSASLASPGSSLPFTTPTPTTPSDTTGLYTTPDTGSAYTETPAQQQESSLSSILEGLNTQDAGRAGAQTSAESAAGIPAMQQTVKDLTSQRQLLAAKAAQINAAQQPGQGVTSAIDSRQRTEALRQNSIDDGLLASSLNAAQGNLSTAQALADKVVSDVYDPIEAQIKADTENLNLIKNDPNTTLQEQEQAQAQLDIKNQQAQAIADQKSNLAAVLKVATDAAAQIDNFTPNGQYHTATQAIQAIQQAHDPITALNIAINAGLTGGTKTGTWGPTFMLNGNAVQQNSQTGEIKTVSSRVPNTATPASQTYTIPTPLKEQLLGTGNTEANIGQLQSDIAAHGAQYVLDNGNMDPATQQVIETEFGITKTAAPSQFNLFDPSTWGK